MVWILFMYWTYYDFDTHYGENLLGVYSSREKAEKAMDIFNREYEGEAWPNIDEWELDIKEFDIDSNEFYGF